MDVKNSGVDKDNHSHINVDLDEDIKEVSKVSSCFHCYTSRCTELDFGTVMASGCTSIQNADSEWINSSNTDKYKTGEIKMPPANITPKLYDTMISNFFIANQKLLAA